MRLKKILIVTVLYIGFSLAYGSENHNFAQEIKDIENEKPSECEYVSHALDFSIIGAKESQNTNVIFIFYLGKAESPKNLIERRKKKIEDFIKAEMPDLKQIVMAEGARRNGLGKIEIYIKGKLEWELFFKKNLTHCVE